MATVLYSLVEPHVGKMIAAFDPFSCAIFAHVVERSVTTCLCPIRRPRIIPRARRWLRIHSERVFEETMEDVTEPLLDMVNCIEPGAALVVILFVCLRVYVVANTTTVYNNDSHEDNVS
jgi:hypothetical protein